MHPPSIDKLLREASCLPWSQGVPRPLLLRALRAAAAVVRNSGSAASDVLPIARRELDALQRPSLRPVLNATGVLLHTNLGRAPLSERALQQIQLVAAGYCNLELDLETGKRGHRHAHVVGLLQQLCSLHEPDDLGVVVVNNCAAAMALIVDEFARGREVLVSRGELVEIGGSFRVPDLLKGGGARLVEVGTTNRTYVRDFANALSDESAMILSTHQSNFAQLGFVHRPEASELVALARDRNVLSVLDLGSGLVAPLPGEPTVPQSVAQGWDLVAFSGDKLLGGPQAGIIVGRPRWTERLASNPWMRALRLDKLRLAALEACLWEHCYQPDSLPLLAMLTAPVEVVQQRAQRLARRLRKVVAGQLHIEVRSSQASLGGGTTPQQSVPSWAVGVRPARISLEELSRRLRRGQPAVLARKHQDQLWLDARTLADKELPVLVEALQKSLEDQESL